jgi:hypothetical protein
VILIDLGEYNQGNFNLDLAFSYFFVNKDVLKKKTEDAYLSKVESKLKLSKLQLYYLKVSLSLGSRL